MKKLTAILFGIILSVCLLLGIVYVQCVSPGLMTRRFEAFSTVEMTQEAYRQTAHDITAYLDGKSAELNAFTPKEQAHMQDVRTLITLLKRVWSATLVTLALLWLPLKKPRSYGIIYKSLCGVLAALALVVLWGVIDFNGLFIQFHKLAFTNDLWLLDPTDLLIQLMPLSFFMAYGLSTGLVFLFLMLVAVGVFLRAERNNGELLPRKSKSHPKA